MKTQTIDSIISKHNYITPLQYIFSSDIWEYDIKQANINALRATNSISDEQYQYLSNVPKDIREIYIGKLQREDNTLKEKISKGIELAKLEFAHQNNMNINNIIRIANDSIYYCSPYVIDNRFININGHILEFVIKNHFTSFLNLNRVLLFLNLNNSEEWVIDIKGINDSLHKYHEDFLTAVCSIVQAKRNAGTKLALNIFNKYYEDYVNRRLSINNYREFNADSCFRISTKFATYLYPAVENININIIDINYNLFLLRNLYSYILIE